MQYALLVHSAAQSLPTVSFDRACGKQFWPFPAYYKGDSIPLYPI